MEQTRREFIRTGVAATCGLGLFSALGATLAAPRAARAGSRDTVVVAVNLDGGNDGLNTVIPMAQYGRYRDLRPTIGFTEEQLIPVTGFASEYAFAAGLESIAHLFVQRKVAIINGVGFPADSRGLFDHEASQLNMQAAGTEGMAPTSEPTGWLGRFLDDAPSTGPLPGGILFSGGPLLLTGARTQPLTLTTLGGFGITPSGDAAARYRAYRRIQALHTDAGVKERNNQLRSQVVELSGTLQGIAASYEVTPGVIYPTGALPTALRDCAALIAADQGVRCLGVGFGSFDTHGSQNIGVGVGLGYHQLLLKFLSDALAAFYADLAGHGVADRVVILAFSEFGRRALENSDAGTDHGFGSIALVIGDPVRGGIYGAYPDLNRLVLNGNLDVHTDFRSVYATILAQHLGTDPGPILRGDFEPLKFL